MNWQENMILAIDNQSSSITSLQMSQAQSTEMIAAILNNVYQQAEQMQEGYFNIIAAFNAFFSVMDMDSDAIDSFFESQTTSNSNQVPDGAYNWRQAFNKTYGGSSFSSQYQVTIQDPDSDGSKKDSKYDEPSDWTITFTIDGQSQTVEGDVFINNSTYYMSEIQDASQGAQQIWSNQEQGDQSILQDQQSGVQSTAQAGANILSTGSSIAQGMGFTSSLLASPM